VNDYTPHLPTPSEQKNQNSFIVTHISHAYLTYHSKIEVSPNTYNFDAISPLTNQSILFFSSSLGRSDHGDCANSIYLSRFSAEDFIPISVEFR
jgi:hypothetical protein